MIAIPSKNVLGSETIGLLKKVREVGFGKSARKKVLHKLTYIRNQLSDSENIDHFLKPQRRKNDVKLRKKTMKDRKRTGKLVTKKTF